MSNTIFGAVLAFSAVFGTAALAQTCGGTYTVQRGDSLSVIADTQYKNASMWTAIHAANLAVIGESPDALRVGMKLTLGCIDGLPAGLPDGMALQAAVASPAVRIAPGTAQSRDKINLLTAGDYAPFTDPELPGGGLLTEVVDAAMTQAAPAQGYAIHWVNDWGAHLEPLLSNALLDLGFPWFQPDCAVMADTYRCQNFHFSDPMFEMLILLFTNKADPMPFASDADVIGKRLCRPNGYFTHDLDRADRRWLADGKITLAQPQAVAECFEMLVAGEVDAVALNEFVGRTAINTLNLKDKVEIVQARPLSIEGLHVLVHKSHPEAEAMLATINGGLRDIKENGTYQKIIDRHMSRIWADF
ncbi:transporter substrate-binding domain-containing protein [uncultured Lentibacter sp.]|uniref:transporter substrate-binding domain-containing protein n=1 Tax=uncultured Lentibacter sp. TaxID=1659309 RepID=UPI00260FFEF7|nr:transporter substrate-binding domain-containing protein [uncultured Lentibacter sp.]